MKSIGSADLLLPWDQFKCADFVFKCLNGTVSEVFQNYFVKLEHGKATRRNGMDLRMLKVRMGSGERRIYYSGIKIFNDLPLYNFI